MSGSLLASTFVTIGLDSSALKSGLSGLGGMLGGIPGIGIAISGSFGLASAAIGSLAAGLGICAAAAMEAETANAGLASAIAASGQDVDSSMKSWGEYTNRMMRATSVGDETASEMAKLAVNMGLPVGNLEAATSAAIGLSRAYGMDLQTAMANVTKEQLGVTSKLDKTIPALKGVTDQNQRLAIISEMAGRGLAQEEDAGNTASGALTKMWTAIGEVGETIGSLFIPMITWASQLVEDISWYLNDMASAAIESSGIMETLGPIFASIGQYIEDVIFTLLNWDVAAKAIGIEMAAFCTGVVDRFNWLWDNIKIGTSWLVSNFPTLFATAFTSAMTILENYRTNVANLIKEIWDYIATAGKDPIEFKIKPLLEGVDLGKGMKGPELKGFDKYSRDSEYDGQRNEVMKEMMERRQKWDEHRTQQHLDEPDLEAVKAPNKEKKKKDKTEAGSFQGLGEAWKKANSAAAKNQEAREKEQIALAKKNNELLERQNKLTEDLIDGGGLA